MTGSNEYPDHVRAFRLFWRARDEPSPRSGLTVERIVDAALALVQEAGLAGLSMRKVADRLGVGAMSLYTYVPGKDELVMLLRERALGELPSGPSAEGWRERLEALARSYWELYQRHPWLLDVPVTRPVGGPNAFDRSELELRMVDGIGLDDLEMNGVIEVLHGHVAAVSRSAFEARSDAERSGLSDDDWWAQVEPVLDEVTTGRDYPVTARVGMTIGAPHTDPTFLLEFGLTRILDGVAALIAERVAQPGDEP